LAAARAVATGGTDAAERGGRGETLRTVAAGLAAGARPATGRGLPDAPGAVVALSADAVPAWLAARAAPIPRATANPPTRPIYLEAPMSLLPTTVS